MQNEVKTFYDHYMVWEFLCSKPRSHMKCIHCNRISDELLAHPRISCLSDDEKIIKSIIE